MIPAAELKVLVGVYGIPEANKKLVKFDADLKALASSDPTVTLHAEVDDAGFEAAGIKKAIFEDPATTKLQAEVDDLGFEEGALKKAIFEESVTTHLQAEATGFATVIAQLDALRTMAKAPIVQEVQLKIDKSSLATLGAEEAAVAAMNGNGNGHSNGNGNGAGTILGGLLAGRNGGKGILPTALWGNHSPGGMGPWWMRALMGGGLLAGAGSLGSFAGFGAEHFLFTGLGLAGSAGSGLAGAGLLGAGALGTMAVGSGSDMAVMKSTIADTAELGKLYATLQEQVALYGAHSKQAAVASAHLHLAMREMGPAAKPELKLAKQAEGLNQFWDHETQNARIQATKILSQVVHLGHDYVPLVAHAAERNLAIVNKDLKPLFSWLEGPEGTGIFKHLENEFAHNLPTAMHATDQGVQFVLKTLNVASQYTGGFIHTVDEFFTKWNEPQNFQKWEGEIGHLVGDFHLWMNLIKALGTDIFDLFSQDAGTGKAIVVTITEMLHHLDEWERSTEGKAELHNLFVVHREEIVELLHVIPPLIGAISPIYMTVAPFMTEAMTEVLGVVAEFLKTLDDTGPVTRWALGLGLIGAKLGLLKAPFAAAGKWMWRPFAELLAKAPLIGGFFEAEETATEKLIGATEGLTGAVDNLTASYEAMGVAAQGATDAAAARTVTSTEIGAGVGAQTEAALGLGAGGTGGAGVASFGGAPLLAGGTVAYTVLELASHSAGSAAESASARLKQLDQEGRSTLGSFGRLAEGLPNSIQGSVVGWAESGDKAHRLLQIMELMHLVGAKRSVQLREEGRSLLRDTELTGKQRTEFEHMLTKAQKANVQVEAHSGVHTLESGRVTRISDIKQLAAHDAEEITLGWAQGSKGWRRATAENMIGVVDAIKAGEKQGVISTEEGQQEIAHYLREYHLLTGNDPFHVASAFTHTWVEAGQINEAGISRALSEMRKMPPVSQAIAEQTMLHQVKAFERGGQVAKGTFSRLRSAIVTELQRTREHGGAQVERFASEFDGSFGVLSTRVTQALENIGVNVGTLMSKLGVPNALRNFTLRYMHGHGAPTGSGNKYLSQVPEFSGHQTGGFTVPGHSTGDQHPYLLPHESFILNQRATAAYGLQRGGMSPVLLESGERVFMPHEVKAVGAHKLERINAEVPRFQHGGMLGPEPHLQGQKGPLLDLGQHAIHSGYAAAQHYLGAHQPHGGEVGYIPGGGGPVVAQMGHVLLADGFNRVGAAGPIGNAWRESRWDPAAVGTGGGGLFGFTSGEISLAALQAAAKRAGVPWTDVGFQVAFMLRHGGSALRSRLNAANSPEESARIFMEDWERPGIPALAEREAAARKAFAMGYAEGGLIEQEEKKLGVPNSKAASKATPTHAVQWEMSHLGQSEPWNSENPGEWCGDFQAGAMRAIGLTPPSGYPAAAAWANYGTSLGKNNLQAGAIIDYGHQHVAMALDSSKMISGNWGGVVATSPIESAVEGTPITAVRWPPYGHGPGAGSAPTEKVPPLFHGAHTKTLSFPGIPKSLQGVEKEIRRWRSELGKYEHAASLAAHMPKTQRAIQANITRIQKYLRELERARHQLRQEVVEKRFSRKLHRALGKVTGYEQLIEARQRDYNIASQNVEQIVGLEPQETILPASASEETRQKTEKADVERLENYINGTERPAFQDILGKEADWRNTILRAEYFGFGPDKPGVSALEWHWEGKIYEVGTEIERINAYTERVKADLEAFHQQHPKAKGLPAALKKEIAQRDQMREKLPILRAQDSELRKVLGEGRGLFYPGVKNGVAVAPPNPPLPGTGSFEDALIEVQGIHWPDQHERLATLPSQRAVGQFGGVVWDTQSSIEELGLKIQQAGASLGGIGASGAGSGNTERDHLLEELLLQAHEREAVGEIERQTLHGARLLPYAGGYEAGGHVAALVGEQGPELIETRPGAYIRNANETSSLLSPKVEVHYWEGERRAEVKLNGRPVDRSDVEEIVHTMNRQGSRTARRGLARAGS